MKLKQLLISFLSMLLAAFSGVYIYNYFYPQKQQIENNIPLDFVHQTIKSKIEFNFDFTESASKTVGKVVHIMTSVDKERYLKNNPLLNYFLGDNSNFEVPVLGSGSGVIISPEGYIVTNNHVIANFDKITVILNNKRQYKAKIIGKDLGTDLALLKIDAKNLPAIKFANSDSVKVGQWVLAVGNPFNLTSTVTAGIISAKARNIHLLKDKQAVESFLQTDAAVNPGNSGGALVNPRGELVGINTAIASRTGSYAGYSFAIPSNMVKKIVWDLKRYGMVQRAMLGVKLKDITEDIAQQYKLSFLKGVYVYEVQKGSSAFLAGIKKSDIIVEIGDKTISKVAELKEQMSLYHPGDKIKLKVYRGNKAMKFMVTLKSAAGASNLTAGGNIGILGAHFSPIHKKNLDKYHLSYALKVDQIFDGKLKNTGMKKNFIITKYNNIPIKSFAKFKSDIENFKGGLYLEGYLPTGEKAYYAFGLN